MPDPSSRPRTSSDVDGPCCLRRAGADALIPPAEGRNLPGCVHIDGDVAERVRGTKCIVPRLHPLMWCRGRHDHDATLPDSVMDRRPDRTSVDDGRAGCTGHEGCLTVHQQEDMAVIRMRFGTIVHPHPLPIKHDTRVAEQRISWSSRLRHSRPDTLRADELHGVWKSPSIAGSRRLFVYSEIRDRSRGYFLPPVGRICRNDDQIALGQTAIPPSLDHTVRKCSFGNESRGALHDENDVIRRLIHGRRRRRGDPFGRNRQPRISKQDAALCEGRLDFCLGDVSGQHRRGELSRGPRGQANDERCNRRS